MALNPTIAIDRGRFLRRLKCDKPLALFANLAEWMGNLLRTSTAPYHLSTSCGSHGGGTGGAPCVCPSGFAVTYTVSGFGSLTGCPQCDASTDPSWPGTLYQSGTACLFWALDPTFDPYSINGDSLDIAYTQVLLRTTVTPCRWELYIACSSLLNPTKTMWLGYKTSGSTPVGTYSFVSSDCGNTTPALTVS